MARQTCERAAEAGRHRTWIPPTSLSHRREDHLHVLLWLVHGEAEFHVGDTERSLTAGHALWVPRGTHHGFTTRANSVTVPLFFPAERTATTLREPTVVTVHRDLRPLMLAYSVSLHTEVRPEANLARQILALVEAGPALSTALPLPAGGPARHIAETLRLNPGDPRSVEELAASAHTTSRTVERAFRAETGMTLREWRIRHRMEAAATLLRTDTGLDAVAHRVGYTNVNSFRRVFTGHFGLSPTAYAKRYRTA
ncbi:AraC family transcriptional regulator [Streptomyces lonarensis]|uniref:Helix-turn-helix transcriptional regulator n=1 Tax=Streptomyces lonarensis TaxID=700599 RepID=A0A7X6HZT9_9ACTN|nr:AraC family transcriptional regulator [Streptomyces lonarensis]NJQ06855.1 helix-turn-helix transcriptional regulator [Streptomyces lonarensis]